MSGRPLAGIEPQELEVTSPRTGVTILDYDEEARVLVVDSRTQRRGMPLGVRYPVDPRLPQGAFAAVEIRGGGGPLTGAPLGLQITFRPERKRWSYYCVTDLTAAADTFQIVDLAPPSAGEPLVFSAGNRRDLGQDPDPTDPVATLLAKQHATLRRIRFVSDQPVSCQSAVRKHLELRLGGQRVSGPLPNPPLANFSTLDLPGSDGAEKSAAQFCIVTHLTRSRSNIGG